MSDDRNILSLGIVELVRVIKGDGDNLISNRFLVVDLEYSAAGTYMTKSQILEGPVFQSRHDAEKQLLIDVTHAPPWFDEVSVVNKPHLYLDDKALSWTEAEYPDYESYPEIKGSWAVWEDRNEID